MDVSKWVAKEMDVPWGGLVAFKVRHKTNVTPQSQIIFYTDGELLQELCTGFDRSISTIIIDEAHERTANIDFLLAVCKELVLRNSSLRVVVMSATMDYDQIVAYFGDAPVIHILGRTHPVELGYIPQGEHETLTE